MHTGRLLVAAVLVLGAGVALGVATGVAHGSFVGIYGADVVLDPVAVDVGEPATAVVTFWSGYPATVTATVAGESVTETVEVGPGERVVELELPTDVSEGVHEVEVSISEDELDTTAELHAPLVVGEPAVESLSIEHPPWLAADPLSEEWFLDEPALQATIEGENHTLTTGGIATVDGEPVTQLSEWTTIDHGEEVTFEAALGNQSVSETVPVVTDRERIELRPEEEIEPGEEAWLVADPAGLSPRHIQHAAWIEVEDPAVASVDRSAVLGESPGETSVSLAEVRVDGDYHTIDPPLEGTVTVADPGSELVVEPERPTLEPGERTPVDVSILEPDGTTTDVSEEATIAVGDRSVVGYDEGEFQGLEPGQTQIVVAYEWREANTTVVVEEADGLAGPPILVVGLAVLLGTVAAWRLR